MNILFDKINCKVFGKGASKKVSLKILMYKGR